VDHAKHCVREAALTSGTASAPAGAAQHTAQGVQQQQQQLFKDPGDLSLREGQTIKCVRFVVISMHACIVWGAADQMHA
jgi:hypothetical protein